MGMHPLTLTLSETHCVYQNEMSNINLELTLANGMKDKGFMQNYFIQRILFLVTSFCVS